MSSGRDHDLVDLNLSEQSPVPLSPNAVLSVEAEGGALLDAAAASAASAARTSTATTDDALAFEEFGEADYVEESANERMPLRAGASTSKDGSAHCWNVAYYQPYFNVDTDDVLVRQAGFCLPACTVLSCYS
eukprot:SAG11_NODE_7780_length_1097_cov_1.109218_2_plen_132_part_00